MTSRADVSNWHLLLDRGSAPRITPPNMANTARPPIVAGLGTLAGEYRALLCDVWGVIHDGVRAFPAATAALARYRAEGGVVVLLTNAPRPKPAVVAQLDR